MQFDKALREHYDLYLFECDKGRAMFRLLDYETYKSIRYVLRTYPHFKFEMEDRIWEECVIEHSFPTGTDYLDAGIVTTVAQVILFYSCPNSIAEVTKGLHSSREGLQDAREQIIMTICEAFPSYVPETIEKMSWQTILKRLAQAEYILKKEFEFATPTSQHTDDSGRIMRQLEDFSADLPVDFNKVNREIYQTEHGTPVGDFNLKNIRG